MATVEAYKQIANIDRTQLIETHAPMVKRIAHHLLGRLPRSVQLDDLIQAGMIGLLEAAKNYDGEKGASFETYAGIRIRGTMLDEVRKNDWVPRSVYRNSRKISEAVRTIENETGRDARDSEVAGKLGISLDEYHTMLWNTSTSQVYSFEDIGVTDDVMSQGFSAKLVGPFEGLAREKFGEQLGKAIESLPEREKLILSLYYDEEMNLKEIGIILEVSESRVCQLHSQAMHRLRARLSEWRYEFSQET